MGRTLSNLGRRGTGGHLQEYGFLEDHLMLGGGDGLVRSYMRHLLISTSTN